MPIRRNRRSKRWTFGLLIAVVLVAAAGAAGCGADDLAISEEQPAVADQQVAGSSTSAVDAPGSTMPTGDPSHPDGWPGITEIPQGIYDPFLAGEQTPDGFRQLIARDRIAPVYVPTFVSAGGVSWPQDELVVGVNLEGEARAYPVGFLTRREIVVDLHRGIPTLVTW